MKPTFFATPVDFRRWLKKHHRSVPELWVGFRKKASGRPSITWPESVEEALCFGWIDGLRKRVDEEVYVIRFTPRRSGSIWSAVNTRLAKALIHAGRMQPAGRRAFEARDPKKTRLYSFEQRAPAAFDRASEARFRANRTAWAFFTAQPPGYRQQMTFMVMSAKQEATLARRLDWLIKESAAGRRLDPMRPMGAAGNQPKT